MDENGVGVFRKPVAAPEEETVRFGRQGVAAVGAQPAVIGGSRGSAGGSVVGRHGLGRGS
jgi:hypothetical protein